MHTLKDDPSRTADYGFFPWEREPSNLTAHGAADVISEALTTNTEAYGLKAAQLVDRIYDELSGLNTKELADIFSRAKGSHAMMRIMLEIADDWSE